MLRHHGCTRWVHTFVVIKMGAQGRCTLLWNICVHMIVSAHKARCVHTQSAHEIWSAHSARSVHKIRCTNQNLLLHFVSSLNAMQPYYHGAMKPITMTIYVICIWILHHYTGCTYVLHDHTHTWPHYQCNVFWGKLCSTWYVLHLHYYTHMPQTCVYFNYQVVSSIYSFKKITGLTGLNMVHYLHG